MAKARTLELLVVAAILIALNLPLFLGGSTQALSWSTPAFANGEWWRLFTHSLVHVTPYHFLLDGAAFLILYNGLEGATPWRRLGPVAASGAGSLAVACVASPLVATHGLCGLSGIAHGLMALSALESFAHASATRLERNMATITFVAVIGKCFIELITGTALFASFHLGGIGTPIVACHAGGVLGALGWHITSRHP